MFHEPVPVPGFVKNLHVNLLDPADPEHFTLYLVREVVDKRACFACQNHIDFDMVSGYDNLLDKPEIDNIATASGQAAITYALLNITSPGDEIVSGDNL
ncbi:MAG: hypothetical protein METHP_01230 [Methanoregula sp. SKADARSKE-2]|nr:MAG: hypothetical protein METHP_01230 [Methanoregula sp. SKADARSKE-2]